MGVLKHIFGDDMTPEERARLEHGELMHAIACHRMLLTGRAMQIYHDRFYGRGRDCKWCDEPRAEKRAIALQSLADAFARPGADPQPKSPGPNSNGDIRAELERQMLGSILGFSIAPRPNECESSE